MVFTCQVMAVPLLQRGALLLCSVATAPDCLICCSALANHSSSFYVPTYPFSSSGEELHDAAQHGCMPCVGQAAMLRIK